MNITFNNTPFRQNWSILRPSCENVKFNIRWITCRTDAANLTERKHRCEYFFLYQLIYMQVRWGKITKLAITSLAVTSTTVHLERDTVLRGCFTKQFPRDSLENELELGVASGTMSKGQYPPVLCQIYLIVATL